MTRSSSEHSTNSRGSTAVTANAAAGAATAVVNHLVALGLTIEPVSIAIATVVSSGVGVWHTARGERALRRLLRNRPSNSAHVDQFLSDLEHDENLQDLLIESFETMTRTSSDRKLSAIAQIVWGHRKARQTSVTRRQILLRIVRELSDWHWVILEHLASGPRYIVDGPLDNLQLLVTECVYPRAAKDLAAKVSGHLDEFTPEFLWMVVMQLEQWGLVKHDDQEYWPDKDGPDVRGWQQLPLTEVGDQAIRLLRLEPVDAK